VTNGKASNPLGDERTEGAGLETVANLVNILGDFATAEKVIFCRHAILLLHNHHRGNTRQPAMAFCFMPDVEPPAFHALSGICQSLQLKSLQS
jgi:hypothetical protein